MRRALIAAAIVLAPPADAALAKAGVEIWRPMSNTAASITGPIRLSPTLLSVGRARLPLRVAGDVRAFKADTGIYSARILEATRPADPVLLHGNRLCGDAPVQWLVVYRSGKDQLGMSAFRKGPRPTSDDDAGLCGTYTYVR